MLVGIVILILSLFPCNRSIAGSGRVKSSLQASLTLSAYTLRRGVHQKTNHSMGHGFILTTRTEVEIILPLLIDH